MSENKCNTPYFSINHLKGRYPISLSLYTPRTGFIVPIHIPPGVRTPMSQTSPSQKGSYHIHCPPWYKDYNEPVHILAPLKGALNVILAPPSKRRGPMSRNIRVYYYIQGTPSGRGEEGSNDYNTFGGFLFFPLLRTSLSFYYCIRDRPPHPLRTCRK